MNLESGEIQFNDKTVDENITKTAFIAQFTSEITSYIRDEFNFNKPIKIISLDFWIEVEFEGEKIKRIQLKNADPLLKNTYSNWSNDKVELKKKSHEDWLIKILGTPHKKGLPTIEYIYNWGMILSFYDPRSGDTGIVISYNQ